MLCRVIQLSPADTSLSGFTVALAKEATADLKQKSKDAKAECAVKHFKAGCFSDLPDRPATAIACIGHCGQKVFGDELLSPEGFVTKLKACGCPLEKISSIYLIGCEAGFTVDNKSYAQRVAELLQKDYPNIVVHAFTNWGMRTSLGAMFVSAGSDSTASISGITKEKHSDFVTHLRIGKSEALERIKGDARLRVAVLKEKIAALSKEPRNPAIICEIQTALSKLEFLDDAILLPEGYRIAMQDLFHQCKRLESEKLDDEAVKISIDGMKFRADNWLTNNIKLIQLDSKINDPVFEYFIKVHAVDLQSCPPMNAKLALDNNPNNILSKYTLEKMKDFDENRKQVWTANNERIAEIRMSSTPDQKILERLYHFKAELEDVKKDLAKNIEDMLKEEVILGTEQSEELKAIQAKLNSTPSSDIKVKTKSKTETDSKSKKLALSVQLIRAARLGLNSEVKRLLKEGCDLSKALELVAHHDVKTVENINSIAIRENVYVSHIQAFYTALHFNSSRPEVAEYLFDAMDVITKQQLANDFVRKGVRLPLIPYYQKLGLEHMLTSHVAIGVILAAIDKYTPDERVSEYVTALANANVDFSGPPSAFAMAADNQRWDLVVLILLQMNKTKLITETDMKLINAHRETLFVELEKFLLTQPEEKRKKVFDDVVKQENQLGIFLRSSSHRGFLSKKEFSGSRRLEKIKKVIDEAKAALASAKKHG